MGHVWSGLRAKPTRALLLGMLRHRTSPLSEGIQACEVPFVSDGCLPPKLRYAALFSAMLFRPPPPVLQFAFPSCCYLSWQAVLRLGSACMGCSRYWWHGVLCLPRLDWVRGRIDVLHILFLLLHLLHILFYSCSISFISPRLIGETGSPPLSIDNPNSTS